MLRQKRGVAGVLLGGDACETQRRRKQERGGQAFRQRCRFDTCAREGRKRKGTRRASSHGADPFELPPAPWKAPEQSVLERSQALRPALCLVIEQGPLGGSGAFALTLEGIPEVRRLEAAS